MFPFPEVLDLGKGRKVPWQIAHERIGALLTPERRQKIVKVVAGRTFNVSVVLENIYDRGNASAVMRSSEALGFGQIHMVDPARFKEANRVTQGADKWVEVRKWNTSEECLLSLKGQGVQLLATHLDATAVDISTVDFSKPSAIILGNEKDGISAEVLKHCDQRIILPMGGFVQSYNISVAGALCLYHAYCDRIRRLGSSGDLNASERLILESEYFMRTQSSSMEYLQELATRGAI
jgi:tRNA (guanosine-2'-O-)-methyltransferase